jgi:hypothetical protein
MRVNAGAVAYSPSTMRSGLALLATALAALAAVIASEDGDGDVVPFFVGLAMVGAVTAWSMHDPFTGPRRALATAGAAAWLVAAAWAGLLLLNYQVTCACTFPPQPPEATYLGLTATVYHVVGLFGGAALLGIARFLPTDELA